ncbi:DUF1015 domain-containing protein [candidate division KSB1 bacterium]|nr:MAG: DUF1015 domain-containing protein [candidate division KSB1 bacterium]
MAIIKPFKGLRPVEDKIQLVASPPYDVLNSEEARQKAAGNPYSFLHVVKPEIDLDPGIDLYDPKVYQKGRENLDKLVEENVLKQDEKPCLYIYKLTMGNHQQTGIVACCSVDDYEKDIIKKHEFTRIDKENDRMRHIDSLNAQTGPVFLTYRAKNRINELVEQAMQKEPVYDFTGDYSVQHTVYLVDNEELINELVDAFSEIDYLYVADGHHRSASATRVRKARMEANPNHTGEEEYNFFLSVIFPDTQMQILDYNRVIKDTDDFSTEDFVKALEDKFTIEPQTSTYKPEAVHTFGLYINGKWYKLSAKDDSFDKNDPVKSLDVSILQENVLTPLLGITDPRTDKRINFVGGIRGLEELERLVDSGEYKAAFALFPTGIDQLLSVADSGNVMPPKSTWFEPKLASGVVIHKLD